MLVTKQGLAQQRAWPASGEGQQLQGALGNAPLLSLRRTLVMAIQPERHHAGQQAPAAQPQWQHAADHQRDQRTEGGEPEIAPPRHLQRVEEAAHGRAETLEINKERIVALRRLQADEARIGTAGTQAVGDLLLLLHREQDVGVGADRQRLFHPDLCQASQHIAIGVLGQIEPVHRAAQVQVAVRIEEAHEAPRVALQVTFHLEFKAERIIVGLRYVMTPSLRAMRMPDSGYSASS
ncbi:hypothetical protein G6F57_018545 [Rhizopus arrhizus]|nr:hypothetical protein G6F57_018545 [Rhizopus arrhizus]